MQNEISKLKSLVEKKIKLGEDKEKFLLIQELLKNDNCFFQLEMETSICILMDLGYQEIEAKKIYLNLTDEEAYQSIFKINY